MYNRVSRHPYEGPYNGVCRHSLLTKAATKNVHKKPGGKRHKSVNEFNKAAV